MFFNIRHANDDPRDRCCRLQAGDQRPEHKLIFPGASLRQCPDRYTQS
jgi:hypothetical protein